MKIGKHNHPSQVIIAPMAGVTDQPFRNLCRQYGAHWLVSEMLTSDQSLWQSRKSANRMRYESEAAPRWVQIAGGDAKMLAQAAQTCEALGAEIIDINMGCPAKKVCRKAAGSALMKDEKLVAEILEAVVNAVKVPVTLKMRLGWSRDEQNVVAIAKIAENLGIQLLTIHGRTRADKFTGEVNYAAIKEVVEAVSIPVIANGDIDSEIKASVVLESTGAAAVMIGRAAQGRPWLADQVDYYLETKKIKKNPDLSEIKTCLVTHIVELACFYGELMGPRIARKHVGWYFKALPQTAITIDFLKQFNNLSQSVEQVKAIEKVFLAVQRSEEQAA